MCIHSCTQNCKHRNTNTLTNLQLKFHATYIHTYIYAGHLSAVFLIAAEEAPAASATEWPGSRKHDNDPAQLPCGQPGEGADRIWNVCMYVCIYVWYDTCMYSQIYYFLYFCTYY